MPIALGTDWVISGSMNLLRELRCADSLNSAYFGKVLSDDQLWRMVTAYAADATKTGEKIGRLAEGKVADIAIFRQRENESYRSVLTANAEDVVLTVRGGKVLYGDQALVAALNPETCDSIDVCGQAKAACVQGELAQSYASLAASNANTYPLFFCGAPLNEPSCVPERAPSNIKNGSTPYTGVAAGDDPDGDGIPNASDDCPAVFNPVRPLDNGAQPDADLDGVGDVCDVCPLNANSTSCTPPDPNDTDGDGIANGQDNCPADSNANQSDSDADLKGDACDVCAAPNPGTAPCPTSIYAVKAPDRSLLGQKISLGNVLVTAVGASGFFLQVHESEAGYTGPDYSGIFVYKTSGLPTAGDRVNITTATPVSFFGQVQLSTATVSAALTTSNPQPAPIAVTAAEVADNGSRATKLEGVLVKVTNVTVADIAPASGSGESAPTYEFAVDSGLRINDYFYRLVPFPVVGEVFSSITGIAEYRNGHSKLEPRSATDLLGGPPGIASFGPPLSYTREGSTGPTFPSPLAVTIARIQATDTTVTVSSPSASLTVVGGGVVIPAGQLSAPVSVAGVAQDPAVVLTASLSASTKTATVRVLGVAEVAGLASLTPATASVPRGAMETFTVGLDLPGAAPTVIALSLDPAVGFGTIPATITVPANQLTATFDLTLDAAATGSATLTASLGAQSQTAAVSVQTGANHVVISELAAQGPGGAADEFVELYNPTSAAVLIAGWKLQYRSASGTAYNSGVTFPAGASIPSHGYYLIAGTAMVGTVAADLNAGTALSYSGTAGHVRIGSTGVGTSLTEPNVVDLVGYGSGAAGAEGSAPTPAQTGAASIERKAHAAATATSMESGADASAGNGRDSDNNAADFVIRASRQPQNSASAAEP